MYFLWYYRGFLHKSKILFIWFDCFFSFFCFVFSIVLLNVFVRSGDHNPLLNLFNVILKKLSMSNVKLFCHLHSFFSPCFYPIVEFFCWENRSETNCQLLPPLLLHVVDKHLFVRFRHTVLTLQTKSNIRTTLYTANHHTNIQAGENLRNKMLEQKSTLC